MYDRYCTEDPMSFYKYATIYIYGI